MNTSPKCKFIGSLNFLSVRKRWGCRSLCFFCSSWNNFFHSIWKLHPWWFTLFQWFFISFSYERLDKCFTTFHWPSTCSLIWIPLTQQIKIWNLIVLIIWFIYSAELTDILVDTFYLRLQKCMVKTLFDKRLIIWEFLTWIKVFFSSFELFKLFFLFIFECLWRIYRKWIFILKFYLFECILNWLQWLFYWFLYLVRWILVWFWGRGVEKSSFKLIWFMIILIF